MFNIVLLNELHLPIEVSFTATAGESYKEETYSENTWERHSYDVIVELSTNYQESINLL
jgi:hypothetical protein